MKSFYSIIRYVSNQWSNESIAVGLLVISEKELFFEVSDHKIRLARNLNPKANKLLKFSVNQLSQFVASEKKKFQDNFQTNLPLEKPRLTLSFIKKLHQYNSGVLQFSAPEAINKEFNQEVFERYFNKIVGISEKPLEEKKVQSEFVRKIEKRLYDPLRDKIDVDYKLKKKSLPSLYFDYHLDNIGVNGAIIASSSIDLNNERIDALQKKLAEYEAVVDRLQKFAETKNIGSDHNFYLIADSYKGQTISNMELDAMLQGKINDKFKRISTSELDKVVKKVKEKKATKFSELIEK